VGLHQCPSERNGEGGPVRRLYVPSHVPSHPQTAAEVRGFSLTAAGFTAETDWLLEGDGFEPSVPLYGELGALGARATRPSEFTGGRFDREAPDLSNSGHDFGAAGANQYDRLERAEALDRDAALKSTSWGIAQVMGFNAESVGFRNVREMVTAMMASEDDQLRAMVGFIIHNRLQHALAANDFKTFARGYNGLNFASNHYDTQLAAANAKFVHGGLPDLTVRTGQVLLRFLGHDPGRIDGMMGSHTRSALSAALGPSIRPTDEITITEEVLAQLQRNLSSTMGVLPPSTMLTS
jgi:hypothetical protein